MTSAVSWLLCAATFLSPALASIDVISGLDPAIVSGTPAANGRYPYMASLNFDPTDFELGHSCGAAVRRKRRNKRVLAVSLDRGVHKLIDEFVVRFTGHSAVTATDVILILQQFIDDANYCAIILNLSLKSVGK